MSTRITIESDEPCLVLVLLPRRVEPKRAPRRVIETTAEELPPSRPGLVKVAPVPQLLRAVSR